MKIEVVTDWTGIPIGVATDAADVSEVHLGPAALASIPACVPVPWGVPVLADRAYDSDPLRKALAGEGSPWSPATGGAGCGRRRPTAGRAGG